MMNFLSSKHVLNCNFLPGSDPDLGSLCFPFESCQLGSGHWATLCGGFVVHWYDSHCPPYLRSAWQLPHCPLCQLVGEQKLSVSHPGKTVAPPEISMLKAGSLHSIINKLALNVRELVTFLRKHKRGLVCESLILMKSFLLVYVVF